MLAAQGIATGDIEIAVAGGMESMSNCPYLLRDAREGLRMGNGQLVDSMVNDGLWCSFEQRHMGNAGEVVASESGIARAPPDAYAARSHRRAAAATRARRFPAGTRPGRAPRQVLGQRAQPALINGDRGRIHSYRHGDILQ